MFMTAKHFRKFIGIILIAFSLSSCRIYAPTLKSLDKVKVERSGPTGYIIGTEAVIHNPNRGRIVVKGLNLDIKMNNKTLVSIGKKENIVIKRNTDFSIPLIMEVKSLESVFGDLKSIIG